MPSDAGAVTDLLRAWSEGDPDALDELASSIYEELRDQARRYFDREDPGHTLQPTALVHDVYLRLAGEGRVRFENRAHFFGAVGRLMRRVLVDHARSRRAAKRGGDRHRVTFDEGFSIGGGEGALASGTGIDLLALDDALRRLKAMDPRQERIVELRYFTGLTVAETAKVLGISRATIDREWRAAKAWLLHELRGPA